MIETPAAALISDRLARMLDFFSIGTNDLAQFTLAADRQDPRLESLYDAKHPAVMKLIAMTVENAHASGRHVCICGELAADPSMLAAFLSLGVDELSVAPPAVLPLRDKLRNME